MPIETFQNQSNFTNQLTAAKVYATTQLLSANVDVLDIISSSINNSSVYTTTNSNSAKWSSTYSTVTANSANWNNTYTTLNSNSGNWVNTTNPTASGRLTLTNTFVSVSGQLGGTQYSGISAYGDVNRNVVLAAKGTGSTVAQIADGTAAGGNNRGVYATDWQKIRLGAGGVASGACSTISGGSGNTAVGASSTVGGGCTNLACGTHSTVGGGSTNTASGYYSTVAGGYTNTASTSYNSGYSLGATIGGGRCNTSSGYCGGTTVSGGYQNSATCDMATIGGGKGNTSSGYASTVSGGYNNCASNTYATVGGGAGNTACGGNSTVGGGCNNNASGYNSTVGGGGNNASDYNSTIGGGNGNTASGYYSTIGGGNGNTASGNYSGILGGTSNNTNNQACAFIIGSGITATQSNTTFVNTLCSVGSVYAASVYDTTGKMMSLGGELWNLNRVRPIGAYAFDTSTTTPASAAPSSLEAITRGGAQMNSGTNNGGWARATLMRGLNRNPGTGASINFSVPMAIGMSIWVTSGPIADGPRSRIIIGGTGANGSSPTLANANALSASVKGYGVEFRYISSESVEARLFRCNGDGTGTAYATSSWSSTICGSLSHTTALIITYNGAGTVKLYLSTGATPARPSTTALLSLTGGPTGLGTNTNSYLDVVTVNKTTYDTTAYFAFYGGYIDNAPTFT